VLCNGISAGFDRKGAECDIIYTVINFRGKEASRAVLAPQSNVASEAFFILETRASLSQRGEDAFFVDGQTEDFK